MLGRKQGVQECGVRVSGKDGSDGIVDNQVRVERSERDECTFALGAFHGAMSDYVPAVRLHEIYDICGYEMMIWRGFEEERVDQPNRTGF